MSPPQDKPAEGCRRPSPQKCGQIWWFGVVQHISVLFCRYLGPMISNQSIFFCLFIYHIQTHFLKYQKLNHTSLLTNPYIRVFSYIYYLLHTAILAFLACLAIVCCEYQNPQPARTAHNRNSRRSWKISGSYFDTMRVFSILLLFEIIFLEVDS